MPSLGKSTQGDFGTDDRSRRSIRHDRYSLTWLPGGWLVDFQVGWREKLPQVTRKTYWLYWPPNESKLPEYFMAKTIKNLVILVWTFHIKQCMMPWFILCWQLFTSTLATSWKLHSPSLTNDIPLCVTHDWWMIGDSWWWFMANICRGFCPTFTLFPMLLGLGDPWDPCFQRFNRTSSLHRTARISEWPVSIMHIATSSWRLGLRIRNLLEVSVLQCAFAVMYWTEFSQSQGW